MARTQGRTIFILLLALGGGMGGGGASAQAPASRSFEAVPVQGLSFGPLVPGAPERVDVSDGARRAEIALLGNGVFDISLVLPDALVSVTGARLPVRFRSGDAALRLTSGRLVPFETMYPNRLRLDGEQGPLRLFLGGTALPSLTQAAGKYTTTITVVITTPGT